MTSLELFTILVIAGALVVLLYFYMQDNNFSFSRARSYVFGNTENSHEIVNDVNMGGVGEKMSGMGEKARTVVSGVGEKVSGTGENVSNEGSMMDSVSEKVSGVSEKIKGTVQGVPKSTSKSTDDLSRKIDVFLNDKSDQLIKDWELATKNDIVDIEKRYTKVSHDLNELDEKFNEYRGSTNKKIKKIEERLKKLETVDD